MYRRNFLKNVPGAAVIATLSPVSFAAPQIKVNPTSREYWVSVAEKIMSPVFTELSKGNLKRSMPVEAREGQTDRDKYTYLEALGRTLAGIAPWLELDEDSTPEGVKRKKYFDLVRKCLDNATNPNSPDVMNFMEGGQPVVDAAFFAHGLIRSPKLWNSLSQEVQENIVKAFKLTRTIKPGYSNWLLFSGMIEAFFLKYGFEWDAMRIDYALKKHFEWYKGDGLYGDGPDFHWDYYNSFVIQPMMMDIMTVAGEKDAEIRSKTEIALKRMQRYAAIQERLISPEATFPAIGRSLAYRFGAFQVLAQISLMEKLPVEITPGQVKNALSHVINRMIEAPGTFDKNGWLTIGFCGHQKRIGERYISTGSLYLCMVGLLPLGLKPTSAFWASAPEDWTARKVWSGVDIECDSALY